MGYRPVSRKPSRIEKKRSKKLDKLARERNAYVVLLREYNKDCNTFMAGVTMEMIQDVDNRIAEVDPPTPPPPRISPIVPSKPLPPAKLELVRKGHMA